MRNNNPGNIRLGDKWNGLSAHQDDGSFCQFDEVDYGIRAIYRTLVTYEDKYNIRTVRS